MANIQLKLFKNGHLDINGVSVEVNLKKSKNRWYFGPYKSFLQKAIRRGDIADALGVVRYAWNNGYEIEVLRRLPIIAAEDVNYNYVVPAMEIFWSQKELDKEQLRKKVEQLVVAMCSYHNKTRECGCYVLYPYEFDVKSSGINTLYQYLDDGDEFNASAVVVNYFKKIDDRAEIKNRAEKVWEKLLEYNEKNNLNNPVVKCARGRYYLGGMTGDMLMMFIVAIIGLIRGYQEVKLLPIPYNIKITPIRSYKDIKWYAFDQHTILGRKILNIVANKHKIDYNLLADISFFCESAKGTLNNIDGIVKKYITSYFMKYGFYDIEEIFRIWNNKYRNEIKMLIENKLKGLNNDDLQ